MAANDKKFRIGIIICLSLIFLGFVYLFVHKQIFSINYSKENFDEIIQKLEKKQEEVKIEDLRIMRIVLQMISGFFHLNEKVKDAILLKEVRKLCTSMQISEIIEEIKELINTKKKIDLADVFFRYIFVLIFFMSGIIGLFWLSIWKAREDREDKENSEITSLRQLEEMKLKESKVARELEINRLIIKESKDKEKVKAALESLGKKNNDGR
jgi:hypothetical protein